MFFQTAMPILDETPLQIIDDDDGFSYSSYLLDSPESLSIIHAHIHKRGFILRNLGNRGVWISLPILKFGN